MFALLLILAQQRSVAVTIDDLPVLVMQRNAQREEQLTTRLLATLEAERIPGIGFVNEGKLYDGGKLDAKRADYLKRWLDAGMELGNHSYSHRDLNRVPLAQFEADVIRGEQVTGKLLKDRGQRLRYFRHPFLHSGGDLTKRRAFEDFLQKRGYRIAPVTVDNYDYVFARAYERALARRDQKRADEIGRQYVAYMNDIFAFHEDQSRKILGREPAQTLLIHANLLNADYLDELAAMMRKRGYRFVSLTDALEDPAYSMRDDYAGEKGITWLHRWALTAGTNPSVFVGEPAVPPSILREGG